MSYTTAWWLRPFVLFVNLIIIFHLLHNIFFAILLLWSLKDNLLSVQTANTFVAEVNNILLLPRGIGLNGCCSAVGEKWRSSVLSFWQFITILHRFVHISLAAITISISNIASSNLFLKTLTVPSSVNLYIAMLFRSSKFSSKPCRKNLKRVGDVTDPCGSPYSPHLRLGPFNPFTCSCIFLLFTKPSRRFINFPLLPAKPLFHTES